jgi:hypothetical protein
MTAAGPAAGDSWASRLPARRPALPGCGVPCEPAAAAAGRHPGRGCQRRGAARQRGRHQRPPMWVLAHPTPLPLMGPCGRGRWLIGVGRRVVLCEGPLRDAVTLRRCVLGDGDRRGAQADRCGRADLPRPPTTGNTGLLESQVERVVDATPARQSVPVALGELPATLIGQGGEAALHARCRAT